MKIIGIVLLIIAAPIVIPMILGGWGLTILAALGITAALGFLLNIFKKISN